MGGNGGGINALNLELRKLEKRRQQDAAAAMKFLERAQNIPSAIVNRIPKTASRIKEVKLKIENYNTKNNHQGQGDCNDTFRENEGNYENEGLADLQILKQPMYMMAKNETLTLMPSKEVRIKIMKTTVILITHMKTLATTVTPIRTKSHMKIMLSMETRIPTAHTTCQPEALGKMRNLAVHKIMITI